LIELPIEGICQLAIRLSAASPRFSQLNQPNPTIENSINKSTNQQINK